MRRTDMKRKQLYEMYLTQKDIENTPLTFEEWLDLYGYVPID